MPTRDTSPRGRAQSALPRHQLGGSWNDFCDGPYTVIATNDNTVNVWGTPSDTTSFKVTESRKLMLTNSETGASVLVRSAGLAQQLVSDNTVTFTNGGIQLLLQTPPVVRFWPRSTAATSRKPSPAMTTAT